MSKLIQTVRDKWVQILLLILVLGLMIFFFFPHRFSSLAKIEWDNVQSITLHRYPVSTDEEGVPTERVLFTAEETAEILELFEHTYLHRAIFSKDYVNGGEYVGYYFEIKLLTPREAVPVLSGIFTSDLVSIDGTQYRFYGSGFADYFAEYFA